MEKLPVCAPESSFGDALREASSIADARLGECMLLSWYDRERDLESPGHVSECHRDCVTPGWWDYAANRGGSLVVEFDGGRFTFCFRGID